MKRDFSGEAAFIVLRRSLSALMKRVRGRLLAVTGAFSGSGEIVAGPGLDLKNGRYVHRNGPMKIGRNNRIECFRICDEAPSLTLGQNFSSGNNNHIACARSIAIGDGVLLGSNILITDHNHGSAAKDVQRPELVPPLERPLLARPIVIGDNVWICDGAVICPGAEIGDGCVIGPNTVVRGRVEPRSVVR